MRNTIILITFSAMLVACEHNPNWHSKCHEHYSVNDRELALCLKRVKEGQPAIPETNSVTVNSANTQAPTLERLGKAHDRGQND